MDPVSVLSIMAYVITYANCPIIRKSRLQSENDLNTIELECIILSQAMRDVLPFVSLMKDIYFLLKIQGETTELLCSLFENPATFYEDNKGAIALEDSPQI